MTSKEIPISEPSPSTASPVLIPFVCPICAGENAVHLISLSRAGGMNCAACEKWLRATDVMRAMHSPRSAAPAIARAPGARAPPSKRAPVVWPPTAESRASATPLPIKKR